MSKFTYSIVLLICVLSSVIAQAEELVTKTIQLNYRQAEDVISLLRPFLHPNGVMTGDGYKILVKTSNKNYLDLQQLVAEVDVSMRQLRVSVTLDSELAKLENQLQISADAEDDEQEVRQYASGNRKTSGTTQHINVIEGKWANVSTGESVPVGQRVRNPDGTITESITYRSVNNSIQVLPRISGDRVTLFIRPQSSNQTGPAGRTSTRSAETTITGKLKQWILIGGASTAEVNQPGSRVYSTQKSEASSSQMFVKVEVVQ